MTTQASETLPRIFSQKKFIRPPSQATERQTEEGTISVASLRRPRSQSDLQSARKALQSTNSSKAVRLEATAVVYLKKIETLEKQQFLLDRQMRQVKGNIEELRVKRKGGEESTASIVSSRCSTVVSREGPRGKIEVLRKKVDRQHQKVKKVMGEVDKTRREIQTTKKLNRELERELEEWSGRATAEEVLMCELDAKMVARNEEVQRKKMDEIHNKAHLIKEYDGILKKLDLELGKSSSEQSEIPSQFYLTEQVPVNGNRSNKILPQQSPKSRKVGAQVDFLKDKVEVWEQQVQEIKRKMQASTLNEVESKLQDHHSHNFHQYSYLNQRYAHLNELKARNTQLQCRKEQLTQISAETSTNKESQQLKAIASKIGVVSSSEQKGKAEIEEIDELFHKLSDFVSNFGGKTGHQLEMEGEVTHESLSLWLEEVLKVKNRLRMADQL